MEHKSGGDINCSWFVRYSYQRIPIWSGGLGNNRTSGDHSKYYIAEIGQNTKKSPGDLRRLVVT